MGSGDDDVTRSDRSAPAGYGAKHSGTSTGHGVLSSSVRTALSFLFPAHGSSSGGENSTDGTSSSREESDRAQRSSQSDSKRGRAASSSLSSACDGDEPDMSEEEKGRLVSALGVLLRESYRPIFTGDVSRQQACVGVTSIPHSRQLESWDCGITCIQMVLRWLRDDKARLGGPALSSSEWGSQVEMTMDERTERKWLIDCVETESVWTIDLVIVLERLFDKHQREAFDFPTCRCSSWDRVSASYLFCSTKLGVDEKYNEFGYYRNAFSQDEVRVTKRFALAKELGLPMLCLSKLKMAYVIDVVSREHCVAIVLVDNRILVHSNQPHGKSSEARKKAGMGANGTDEESGGTGSIMDLLAVPKTTAKSNFNGNKGPPTSTTAAKQQIDLADKRAYAGHYVVLCGVSTNPDDVLRAERQGEGVGSSSFCLVIKNPGSIYATDFVTPSHFERAWRASGTDDDIVFVSKH